MGMNNKTTKLTPGQRRTVESYMRNNDVSERQAINELGFGDTDTAQLVDYKYDSRLREAVYESSYADVCELIEYLGYH